jgi:hypothetical protein
MRCHTVPLWYAGPTAISNAISFAKFYSRSHDAVIWVYDDVGNVIEMHEHAGEGDGHLLSPDSGPVSLFDCVSFAHVLALFAPAVKTRALLVINVCLGIDPHQPRAAAWCRSRGSSAAGDRCCGRRRAD